MFKIGDRVVLNPNSQYYNRPPTWISTQLPPLVEGQVCEYLRDNDLHIFRVAWGTKKNRYRMEDLIHV